LIKKSLVASTILSKNWVRLSALISISLYTSLISITSLETRKPSMDNIIPNTINIEMTVPIFLGIFSLLEQNLTTGSISEAKKYAIRKGKISFQIFVNSKIPSIIRSTFKIALNVLFTFSDILSPQSVYYLFNIYF
jgi:hypothetical protein